MWVTVVPAAVAERWIAVGWWPIEDDTHAFEPIAITDGAAKIKVRPRADNWLEPDKFVQALRQAEHYPAGTVDYPPTNQRKWS